MKNSSKIIKIYCLLTSLALLAAGVLGAIYTGSLGELAGDIQRIALSPSKLTTDYFNYGSLGAAFCNAGLTGLASTLPVILLGVDAGAPIMMGFFLTLAHSFYGMNILNIWPSALGTAVFCLIRGKKLKENLHVCMLAYCFAPLSAELLFRYTNSSFDAAKPQTSLLAVGITAAVSLLIGFVFPAALDFAKKISGGNNLYNAGLAGGIIATVLYTAMFLPFGKGNVSSMSRTNYHYQMVSGSSYALFVKLFFVAYFLITALAGYKLNGGSFEGYGKMIASKSSALEKDFGMPLCLINIGHYGLFVLAVYSVITWIGADNAAGFTGPTTGVIFAAMSFACQAQTPKNTWPMFAGYAVFSAVTFIRGGGWILSTQALLSSMAFTSGLCPVVNKRGISWGILAGFIAAAICTYPAKLHGGLMIFNSGFTTGITAVIITILSGEMFKKQ